MNSAIRLIIFFSLSFSSYLSLYGFGEYTDSDYPLSYFITESSSYFIEKDQSSTIWNNYETVFNIGYSIHSNEMDEISIYNSYLSSLSYTIPMGKSKYLTFGINPYTLSNINFMETSYNYIGVEENSNLTNPLSYNTNYMSNGGISKAYLNFTYKFSDKFYIGIKNSHLFGNLEHQKIIRLYDIVYGVNDDGEFDIDSTLYSLNDSMIVSKVNEFKGNSLQLEGKYINNNNEFILSATYDLPLKIRMKMFLNPFVNPSNESLGLFQSLEEMEYYTDPNQTFSYKLASMLKNYSLGYRWKTNDESILFRLMRQNGYDYNSNLMYLEDCDINSINVLYSKDRSFLGVNKFQYSFGLFYKTLETSESNDYDYGFSGDFDFRFIDKDAFNISFTIGERTHNLLDISNEKYFSLRLNLENVEKWFIKGEN